MNLLNKKIVIVKLRKKYKNWNLKWFKIILYLKIEKNKFIVIFKF